MQRLFAVLFAFFIMLPALPAMAQEEKAETATAAPEDGSIAEQAFMVDFDTGTVLFEKNADQKMPTSSMSKVITAYVVFEAVENGKLQLDTMLPVSEKAWRMGGSKMFVEVGKEVSVEDLLRGVIVQSGNDATVVLAEGVAGTEALFADMLNAKAAQLGMKDSHFVNASGWPDPDHYSTARDLATLGMRLIRDFPQHYKYYSEKEFTYHNIKQGNRNPLLYRDLGADGIKTGHTESGGYGLIASGVRNGRRVVLVVNGLDDDKERASESARLLEWGLHGFENVEIFAKDAVAGTAYVAMGKAEQVPLVVENDIAITVPVAVKNDLKVDLVYDEPVMAPVSKGQKLGVVRIAVPRGQTIEAPLLAGEDVEKLGLIAGALAKAKIMLGGGK